MIGFIKKYIFMLVVLFLPTITWAGWTGPVALVNTTLGDAPEQIPLWKTDMGTLVPDTFYILPDGRVAINDVADHRQLLSLAIIGNVGHQGHVFLPFFARFVSAPFRFLSCF